MNELVIGLDLGGTQIRTVLADEAGHIMTHHSVLTQAEEGPDAVLTRIEAAVRAVLPSGGRVASIGVGVPGPTDPYQGVVLMGPNLPGWHNVNLREWLGAKFRTPVFVGNDANLAGLAEHRYGAGKGVRHMVYITVSTGIGSGVIIDDHMLLGRQGLAAEIGHMTIDAMTEQGGDNVIGTLEGLASGPNIARRAQTALRAGAASSLREQTGGDFAQVTPALLNQAAHAGDAFAQEQWRETGHYLGVGITNILHIFNPDRIVIGGSVWMNAQDLLEDVVWSTIRARAQSPEYWKDLCIVSAALGDDVGLLGAVALAYDGLHGKREV